MSIKYTMNELAIDQTEARRRISDLEASCPAGAQVEYELRLRHDCPDGSKCNAYAWYAEARHPHARTRTPVARGGRK
jgi:hypothetical protein